jgi:hypothetical protein
MTQILESTHAETRWAPGSAEDRELVLKELDALVSSPHFRGSKRYPALLKYVVDAALENRSGDLKERTLGVEVFGRDPNYDTNADPVVRVSAGEVRKRIDQFYHENGIHSRVQIELPVGSYVPEFNWLAADTGSDSTIRRASRTAVASNLGKIILGLAVALLIVGALIWRSYLETPKNESTVTQKLWNPLLSSARPVLIVLGTTHPGRMKPETEQTKFSDHVTSPYHHVSVPSAIALAHLAGVVEQQGKSYEVKESPETSLTDLRSRSVVLVGAINNDWTMRLTSPLRFHFSFAQDGFDEIVDSANPARMEWTVDSAKPYFSITADYALVARFHDPTIEGPVMVIAGLGPYGTQTAGEFVQSPQRLADLAARLPQGWENKNLEVVLKTDVIGGMAGPPVFVTAYTW